jgi:hypothetical protein
MTPTTALNGRARPNSSGRRRYRGLQVSQILDGGTIGVLNGNDALGVPGRKRRSSEKKAELTRHQLEAV